MDNVGREFSFRADDERKQEEWGLEVYQWFDPDVDLSDILPDPDEDELSDESSASSFSTESERRKKLAQSNRMEIYKLHVRQGGDPVLSLKEHGQLGGIALLLTNEGVDLSDAPDINDEDTLD